ncbi:MAG: hypothetical protein LBV48_01470 [Mycoplasmataceae bacterium]|jgi:hypothetical protein|nr:hypothetical protein [Mycoplasmataceae bacterium]
MNKKTKLYCSIILGGIVLTNIIEFSVILSLFPKKFKLNGWVNEKMEAGTWPKAQIKMSDEIGYCERISTSISISWNRNIISVDANYYTNTSIVNSYLIVYGVNGGCMELCCRYIYGDDWSNNRFVSVSGKLPKE